MCGEYLGIDNVDVSLSELAIPTLLGTLASPDLLDLIAPEGKSKVVSVLQYVAGKRHRQIEAQTKIGWLVRIGVQPLDCIYLLVDLTLLSQAIQWFDSPSLDRSEAVQFEGFS